MKTIILARVSTEEQMNKGHSIPAQLEKAREYCMAKNLDNITEYSFDESSIKDHREKFEQIITQIRKSKEKVELVVETIDRLQRSFKESVLFDDFRKQNKVRLHFIRENLILDKDSSSSDLIRWDMGVMVARSYVLQIADNVKRSIREKIRRGEFYGKAPVGYKNTVDEQTGKKTIIIDNERGPIIKLMFEEYSTGNYSERTLLKLANAKGLMITGKNKVLKPISKNFVNVMLKNPFYIGIMKGKHGEAPHKYDALISEDIFNRCQEVQQANGHSRKKKDVTPSIFRGLITCGCCGKNMCIDITVKKSGKKYSYLFCQEAKPSVCRCKNKEMVREEVLLEQVREALKALQMPEYIQEDIKACLKSTNEAEKDFNKNAVQALMREYDNWQKRINALVNMRIDSEAGISAMSITAEEYSQKMQEFKNKQKDCEKRIAAHTSGDEQFNITLGLVLEIAKNAYNLFEKASIEEKNQILNLVTTDRILTGKKLEFHYRKPFDVIAKGLSCPEWLPGLGSNQQP
ncbi:MAG: recombinase family protein [Elusimicrobiota bacterium]|nr:recombinase family protein [Elusimicrobiota bacterium]